MKQPLIILLGLLAMSGALAQETPVTEVVAEEADAPVAMADPFARDSYRIDSVLCPFKADIRYEPGDIDCFLLEVPENRENPESRMIELHVIRLNARPGRPDWEPPEKPDEDLAKYTEGLAPGKRDDPVVYLTGGPGAPATYYVGRFKDHGLLDHRDLYILEQRGIGASDDFCPFYDARKPAEDNPATFEEYLHVGLRNQVDCAVNAKAAGVDLAGYNTIENARDVKALRRALGFEQWNVWGISYGSILGQAYLKEDPEGILAVALDAIMPLEIRGSAEYWRVALWYDRDLRKLQEICDAQPACAKRYPDMGGRLREAIKSMADGPIEVEVKDIEAYPGGKAYIHSDLVAFLPFSLFYEQSNYPALPGLIYAWADLVEARDEDTFRALASVSGGGFGNASEGMRNAILCIDGDVEALGASGRRDLEEFPVLAGAIQSEESLARNEAACAELGMYQRPAEQYAAVQTDIPALIIEGDMDPITPPPNAHAIMPGFSRGTYVEFAYAGHGPSRSVDCAGAMLNKFYDNPLDTPDLSCAEDMEAPKLWAPFYRTSLPLRLASLMAVDRKLLARPASWGGGTAVLLLIGFLVLTFAPLVRRLEGRSPAPAGSARTWAWLASLVGVAAGAVFGAAFAVTAKAGEVLPAFGLVHWAAVAGWLSLVAGVLGLLAIVAAFRARGRAGLPLGSLLGFLLTGLAAVAWACFTVVWGLGPF